jgi:hypothetical protein
METDDGYDPAVWQQMGQQLGLQGLAVPEELGGSGFTFMFEGWCRSTDVHGASYRVYISNRGAQDFAPTQVKPDHVFVMGDNRPNSQDSRSALGQIPMDKVVGKAFVLLWPPSRIGMGRRFRIARLIENSAMNRRKMGNPSAAACPEASPIATMLPRFLSES